MLQSEHGIYLPYGIMRSPVQATTAVRPAKSVAKVISDC
jgi:hypothetical protein